MIFKINKKNKNKIEDGATIRDHILGRYASRHYASRHYHGLEESFDFVAWRRSSTIPFTRVIPCTIVFDFAVVHDNSYSTYILTFGSCFDRTFKLTNHTNQRTTANELLFLKKHRLWTMKSARR
jgi:hypothetical protein